MLFYRLTEGVRITAQPFYDSDQSDPEEGHYVFVYHVKIANEGGVPVQLLWRHWFIHDAAAGDSEVEGEGVVGEQPVVAPGGEYEYQSFCVLRSPRGYMEGVYQFRRPDGSTFDAPVPRFYLRIHEA